MKTKKILIFLFTLAFLSACMDITDQPLVYPAPPIPIPVETLFDDHVPEPEISIPHQGGELRLSMRSPITLNPLLNEDATVAQVLQLMFEPLISLDEYLRPIPHLASLEFAFNGTSVVVTIRDNARWSDGTPVTSEDLAFSIQTLQNAPPEAIYSRNVENFAYFEVLNDRSVRIHFATIRGGAAYLFNFPIIPRHLNDDMAPVGNGPFMFLDHLPMESMTLVRNPYTFRPRSYIHEVHVLITSDSVTDLHAFDRGLVDIFLAQVPEWARHHSVKPVQFAEHLAMHYEFIGFNFDRPLPQLHQFRQAVAHCIDVEGLIADVFLTHAMVASSPIHPASWLHEPNTPIRSYNFELAETLASQTKLVADRENLWPTGEEGERLPLAVLVNEENVERVRIARTLVSQMNAIGLFAELVSLPFEDFNWHLQNGYFDLFVGGYNLCFQPDLRFAFHSESSENLLSLSDPEMDRLLETAAVAATDSGFYRAISDIQLHIAQQLPVVSLAFRHSAIVADRRLQGDLRPAPSNIFANVHEWFLN